MPGCDKTHEAGECVSMPAYPDHLDLGPLDRAAGTVYPARTASGTAITVVVGIAAWAVFAFWAHGLLFGVRPFG